MKNVKIVLLAFVASLGFSSCEDAIDIVQPGELYPETTFQTVNDLQLGLNGVYGAVSGENEIAFTSVFTDEVRIGYANGGQGLIGGEYGFVLNTNSGDAYSIWQSNYTLINFANRIIEGAKNVIPAGDNANADDLENEAHYKDVLAQAHILRAWGHFRLLCYFTTDMTDDNALGPILVDFVPKTTDKLPRNTNGEVYNLINSDLAYVSDLSTNANNANRKYISADFVKAFRARMAAYREDYTTAGTLADELLAAYPLTPRGANGYLAIWKDLPVTTGTDEVIFKLDRVDGDTKVGNIWASVNSTASGSPFYEMSTSLYNLLNTGGDVRKSAFISNTATPPSILPIAKYSGSGGIVLLNDLKIFRSSEMVFIKAEAQAAAGDFAGVAATLQKINIARFASPPVIPVPANATAAWAEILKQRRIELCYEGHRYLDLKRLGAKAGVDINRDPADCAINSACFLSSTDYRFTLPIPSVELGANPAIRNQQNPGYTN